MLYIYGQPNSYDTIPSAKLLLQSVGLLVIWVLRIGVVHPTARSPRWLGFRFSLAVHQDGPANVHIPSLSHSPSHSLDHSLSLILSLSHSLSLSHPRALSRRTDAHTLSRTIPVVEHLIDIRDEVSLRLVVLVFDAVANGLQVDCKKKYKRAASSVSIHRDSEHARLSTYLDP